MKRPLALLVLMALAAGAYFAWSKGYIDRARLQLFGRPMRLSAGDFPAGVSAPVEEAAAVPMRTTMLGFVPRGDAAALLLANGGLFKTSVALDAKAVPYRSSIDLQRALNKGADNGGVDFAQFTVAELAMSATRLRDCAPRAVMLVARSRGQDVFVTSPLVKQLSDLRGKRIATERNGPSHYFALWVLSRGGLSPADVTFVNVDGSFGMGGELTNGDADAAAGVVGELGPAVRPMNGQVLMSTADAPHLLATVLVARGDFAARYPDAVRRVVRVMLEAGAAVGKDVDGAARALGEVEPALGDPSEAIRGSPPASVKDNLGFFGVSGEAPVTYRELYQSAASLSTRLYKNQPAPEADDTVELSALKYVSTARAP